MDRITLWGAQMLAPLVVGPLTALVMQGCKAFSEKVDALPGWQKRAAVAVLAVVLTLGGKVTGTPLTCDVQADATACLSQLSPDVVKGLVAAGLAMVLHAAKPKGA